MTRGEQHSLAPRSGETSRLRRWQRTAALGISALALSGCVATGAGSEAGSSAGTQLTIAEWNTLYTNNPANVGRGVLQLAEGNAGAADSPDPDIIALQETSREDVRKEIIDKIGDKYNIFMAEKARDLPIATKKDRFTPVGDIQDIQVHGKLHFDDGGAGGKTINDRHIVWIELIDKFTDQHFVMANTHILPSNQLDDREKYFEKHIAALKEFAADMRSKNLPVFITMDANTDFKDTDYQDLFESMGWTIIWTVVGFPPTGTHGTSKRVIDATLSQESSNIKLVPNGVVKWPDKNKSDHYPTVTTITYYAADASPEDGNKQTGDKVTWMRAAGIAESDYKYVDYIIKHEGGWGGTATYNKAGSGAYGLCQALPASKMSSAGDDYMTNPITQLKWCNNYAVSRYGGWDKAYEAWQQKHWW